VRRAFGTLVFALLSFAAQAGDVDHVSVYVTGAKSTTNWHGQADLEAIHLELARVLSPHFEIGFVGAAMNVWQPRSWFGDAFHDGNETAHAVSGSLLLRRRFRIDDARAETYIEGSSGPMWADRRVPAATSRFNFISQLGAGLVLRPHSSLPIILGYRFMHISNGGYAPRNPGLNMSSILIGARFRSAMRR
jgi:lipid A 3-O-deacylase